MKVRPYDPAEIADAVSAISLEILLSDGRILLGEHPTMTPMILMISHELGIKRKVNIFQSKWFDRAIQDDPLLLEISGVGEVHWTDRCDTLDKILSKMRYLMLTYARNIGVSGSVFVGGMDGIY